LFVAFTVAGSAQTQGTDRTVSIDGHSLHLRVIRPQAPRPSSPTVLFESGLGDPGTIWDKVIAALPRDLPIVTYDRPGLGSSDDDQESPTPQHIASLLHRALAQVHAGRPYILVGHSFGAPRARTFTAMYPGEVVGLVFVDPTDFTARRDDNLRDVWIPLGLGLKERADFDRLAVEQMKAAPEVIQREFDVARKTSLADYPEFRALPPMPDIPLIIFIARQHPPADMRASFDLEAWYRQTMAVRIASLTRLAAALPRSEVVVTSNPDHGLHRSDPNLVAWGIERITRFLK
jgi:pimeloyl-ACP methyl ester carboxylesterase